MRRYWTRLVLLLRWFAGTVSFIWNSPRIVLAIVLLVFVTSVSLIAWLCGLTSWPKRQVYYAPRPQLELPQAAKERLAVAPVERCDVLVLTASRLLLSCQNNTAYAVSLAFVRTMPMSNSFGGEAKTLLENTIQTFKPVYCRQSGGLAVCHLHIPSGPTLQYLLLNAGLAVTTSDAGCGFQKAEINARAARLGLWWDWNGRSDVDPLDWRLRRDVRIAAAGDPEPPDLNAFAAFFSATLAAVIGIFSAVIANLYNKKNEGDRLRLEVQNVANRVRKAINELRAICLNRSSNIERIVSALEKVRSSFAPVDDTLDHTPAEPSKGQEINHQLIVLWQKTCEEENRRVHMLLKQLKNIKGDSGGVGTWSAERLASLKKGLVEIIDGQRATRSGGAA